VSVSAPRRRPLGIPQRDTWPLPDSWLMKRAVGVSETRRELTRCQQRLLEHKRRIARPQTRCLSQINTRASTGAGTGIKMAVDQNGAVISRIDLTMYFNPHCLLVVLGQTRAQRRGLFHYLGGAAIDFVTLPMPGRSSLTVEISDYDTLGRSAFSRETHLSPPSWRRRYNHPLTSQNVHLNYTPPGGLEDYSRQIYSQYAHGSVPVWIIGPPLDSYPGPESPSEALKVQQFPPRRKHS
jgi:hypothetical protein